MMLILCRSEWLDERCIPHGSTCLVHGTLSFQLQLMAEARSQSHPHPAKKRYTLADAAAAGQLVILHDHSCRCVPRHLAADLVKVVGSSKDAYMQSFDCAKYRTDDYVQAGLRMPRPDDDIALVIHRPKPVKTLDMAEYELG
jgi:hypothetical protein